MRGNNLSLCLLLSVMLSSASQSHISEQQIIQAKQHQPSRTYVKTRTPFQSLLEVGYSMPSKPQGTGKCKGIAKMCKSSPQPEMNYPTELEQKFVDNACFDFQCHICTDLAWNCHVTFSKSFADYNELPEISRAICRQYIASGCEKDMTCCTGLRTWVEEAMYPSTGELTPLLPVPYCATLNAKDEDEVKEKCAACKQSVSMKVEATPHLCQAVLSAAYTFPVTAADTKPGSHKSPLDQCEKLAVEAGSAAAKYTGTTLDDICACLGCCDPKGKSICPYPIMEWV